MASGVGKSPFNGKSIDVRNESEAEMLRRGHYKRMNRSALHSRGEEKRSRVAYNKFGFAQSSGYWKKPSRPEMKELTDSLGNKYYTPDVIDWDDWVDMFGIHPEGELTERYKNAPDSRKKKREAIESLADWCNWSFDRHDSSYDSFDCPEGHIERVDYNNSSKIMRVEFRGSGKNPVRATVCYFYVPKEVYDTLKKLSEGMDTRIGKDGKLRHLVGIYFWDLIRIRGTVHGNRYECCYSASGEGGGLRKVQGADAETAARIESENNAAKKDIEGRLRKDGRRDAADILAGKSTASKSEGNEKSSNGAIRKQPKERVLELMRMNAARGRPTSYRMAEAALNLLDDSRELIKKREQGDG